MAMTQPSTQLAVAVIGAGYWGPNLLRNFQSSERWRAAALVDIDEVRLRKVGAPYPSVIQTNSFEQVLSDKEIDAVAIATPPHLHYEMARNAIRAGKHVLVEKPLCLNVEEAEALVQLAKTYQRKLVVDHTFLYTGAVEYLRRLLTTGALGQVYYIDSVRINLGLFQQSGDVVTDLAPHDVSIINYLLDESPSAVAATKISCVDRSVADVAYIVLHYSSGVVSHVHNSWLSPMKVRSVTISGDKKMATWNDVESDEKIRVYDKGIMVREGEAGRMKALVSYRTGDMMSPAIDNTEALAKLIDDFAYCISTGEEIRINAESGLSVVRTLTAIERSASAGGSLITLNKDFVQVS